MAEDGEASDKARAQGYVRPHGVDTQVKEETNAVLSCHAPDPRGHAPLNGFVEGSESAGCCSPPSDYAEPGCGHSACREGPTHGIIQLRREVDLHVVEVV